MSHYTPHNRSNHNLRRPGDMVALRRTIRRGTMPATGHATNLFCCSPRSLICPCFAAPFLSIHISCLPPSILLTVASPSCCLIPLPHRMACLRCQEWRGSDAIFWLSEQPHSLQQRVLPLVVRPPWHKAWMRAFFRCSLAKQVVS